MKIYSLVRSFFSVVNLIFASAFTVCITVLPAGVEAEESIQFDIPAQDLSHALSAFTAQSHVQVLYEGDVANGLRSMPVTGAYTPEKALKMLLTAAPVQGRFTGSRTATVEPKTMLAQSDPSEDDTSTLREVTVSAQPVDDPSDPYNKTYAVSNTTIATKTDTPIMETPLSIQVVPQQVLKDQQAYRLEDAVKNVSGVFLNPSSGNQQDSFILRGFNDSGFGGAGNNQRFRNGVRFPASGKLAFDNIEQVEVLKGPAAMLFGRIEPGGIINLVTKKPLETPYYALQQEFGSYNYFRTVADATGPVLDDKSLLYRVTVSYLDTDSFRDFAFREQIHIAPSLTWKLSEDTVFNLNYEYSANDQLFDNGIPAIGNAVAPVPISRQITEPGPGIHDRLDYQLVDFNWSHRFNDHWKFRNGVMAQFNRSHFREIEGGNIGPDQRTENRLFFFGPTKDDIYSVYADLLGQFEFWNTKHEVLIGTDYFDRTQTGEWYFDCCNAPIDIFNPVYGTVDVADIQNRPPNFFFAAGQSWNGVYFQDQITLWDNLHILGGGRYDWTETGSGSSGTSLAAIQQSEISESGFSPRVGVLYQPWSWLSVYGNYVESLGANNGRSSAGTPFRAQRSQQYEVGLKTELFDKRLTSTLAFYHLTKQNLLTADLSTLDPNDQAAIGEARSQGIEFDLSGQVTDGLSVIATYAYTDVEVTKGATFGNPLGQQLINVPKHAGSLWAKYDLIPQRLDVGAGVYLIGERAALDSDNERFTLPGYARIDAYAAYHWELDGGTRLTAQINLKNLADKEYFVSQGSGFLQFPGEPFTAVGTLRLEY